ncbi:MAG: hypothetical protein OXH56_04300 [Gemmatimonadetes bacterium]|nr:hypothetical protein [Gemmatimonadota bacterium]
MGQIVIEKVVVAEGMLAEVASAEIALMEIEITVVASMKVASAVCIRVLQKNHGRLAESFHGFVEWDALSPAFCMRKTRSGTACPGSPGTYGPGKSLKGCRQAGAAPGK